MTENVRKINSRFTLAVVSLVLTCLGGFVLMPLGLAALIFALRCEDKAAAGDYRAAQEAAKWAGVFGWLGIALSVLPIIAIFVFLVLFIIGGLGLVATVL